MNSGIPVTLKGISHQQLMDKDLKDVADGELIMNGVFAEAGLQPAGIKASAFRGLDGSVRAEE